MEDYDENLKNFAEAYLDIRKPLKEISLQYGFLSEYKARHLDRVLKKAISNGIIKEEDYAKYEVAKKARRFVNLMGKHFTKEKKEQLYEIAMQGYGLINKKREELAKNLEKKIAEFLSKEKDGKYIETNKFLAEAFGIELYGKALKPHAITKMLNKYSTEEGLIKERRKMARSSNGFHSSLKKRWAD